MRSTIQNYSFSHWRTLILGAVNGVLVGGAAYVGLWLLVEYENQRWVHQLKSGGDIMHTSVGIKWYGLPIIGTIAFALSGYLVHKYFANRVKSILLLWQTVGAASIIFGMLIVFAIALVDQISGAVPLDYVDFVSTKLLLTLLAAFAFVALINLLYGAFIQISAHQYAPHNTQLQG